MNQPTPTNPRELVRRTLTPLTHREYEALSDAVLNALTALHANRTKQYKGYVEAQSLALNTAWHKVREALKPDTYHE